MCAECGVAASPAQAPGALSPNTLPAAAVQSSPYDYSPVCDLSLERNGCLLVLCQRACGQDASYLQPAFVTWSCIPSSG